MIIIEILKTLNIIFCSVSIILIIWFISKQLISMKYIKSFVNYISVLDYNMNKAYEIIHKDNILIYSLEAMRIEDAEFSAISHDFVNLVIKLLGPNLYTEFKKLYGNEETFIFNLIEYFNTRYEEDEIRKESLESLSENNGME